jgi:hypothetical protein
MEVEGLEETLGENDCALGLSTLENDEAVELVESSVVTRRVVASSSSSGLLSCVSRGEMFNCWSAASVGCSPAIVAIVGL